MQSRDELAALVSHDLRNPLTTIRRYARLLRGRGRYDANAVEAIVQQTNQIDGLIGELLDVVSADVDRRQLRLASVDIVELARGYAETARQRTRRTPSVPR